PGMIGTRDAEQCRRDLPRSGTASRDTSSRSVRPSLRRGSVRSLTESWREVARLLLHALVADDLHRDAPFAGGVEFNQEDPLPASKPQGAIDDRYALAGSEQQMLAVRVPVAWFIGADLLAPAQIVVLVVVVVRGEGVQQALEIGEQKRLSLVDAD